MCLNSIWCLLFFYIISTHVSDVQCVRVAVERAKIIYANPKYVNQTKFYVNKYSRSEKYKINLEGEIFHMWVNNVSVHFLIQEELRHAVYQPSFVDFEMKYCDFINKEPYIGGAFKKYGCYCPWPPGYHSFNNFSIDASTLTNVWPFSKGRLEFTVYNNEIKEDIAKGEIFVTFYQK